MWEIWSKFLVVVVVVVVVVDVVVDIVVDDAVVVVVVVVYDAGVIVVNADVAVVGVVVGKKDIWKTKLFELKKNMLCHSQDGITYLGNKLTGFIQICTFCRG